MNVSDRKWLVIFITAASYLTAWIVAVAMTLEGKP
jgi:hypothetical protein